MSKSDKLLYTYLHVFFITTALRQLLKLVGQAWVEGKPYFKQLIRSILKLKVFLFLFMRERERQEWRWGRNLQETQEGRPGGSPVIWGSPETLSVPIQSTGLIQPSREEARRVQWAPVSADSNPSAGERESQGGLLTEAPGPTCRRPLLPAGPEGVPHTWLQMTRTPVVCFLMLWFS